MSGLDWTAVVSVWSRSQPWQSTLIAKRESAIVWWIPMMVLVNLKLLEDKHAGSMNTVRRMGLALEDQMDDYLDMFTPIIVQM